MNNFAKFAALLLMIVNIVGGFLWLKPAVGPFRDPELARIVVFHVPCAMVSSIAAAVGTWYALCYLRRRDMRDDIKCRVALSFALLLLVLTTVTGAIFAKVEWGAYWNWDPKESCILIMMLIYMAYFALRAAIDSPHKRATVSAAYALFALLALPFLLYILPNSVASNHPTGVVTTKAGLDPIYKVVFYSGTIGLVLVFVWVFRLQVALEELAARLGARTQRRLHAQPQHLVTERRS